MLDLKQPENTLNDAKIRPVLDRPPPFCLYLSARCSEKVRITLVSSEANGGRSRFSWKIRAWEVNIASFGQPSVPDSVPGNRADVYRQLTSGESPNRISLLYGAVGVSKSVLNLSNLGFSGLLDRSLFPSF